MKREIDDGGPAFPHVADGGCGPWAGMSLRDYFAGQVVASLIMRYPEEGYEFWIDKSYDVADVLIEARKAKP